MKRLLLIAVIAAACTGCAASRQFRKGQDASHVGNWDAAVTYFTAAVQAHPDNAEYKLELQRAQEAAARTHLEKARAFEQQDQLDSALAEYRRSLDFVSNDRVVRGKIAELERTVRQRVEAMRPKPQIDQLRSQSRAANGPPLLNPASREPLRLNFGTSSLRDILNFIGNAAGINITYDPQFTDKPYSINLDGVTVEEALQQVLSSNGYYYKVTNPRTILVIPDQPGKHQQYDDLVLKVFYLSNADATEVAQTVQTMMRIPTMPVPPQVLPNKTANTISVRGTAPVVDVIERLIRANDKPRAEVLLDIELLEVDRNRLKRYGIDLSSYTLSLLLSPEVAPASGATAAPPAFNLNSITHGVNTADFFLGIPFATLNFLEQDGHTKTLAKPQLRGQEGQKLTLNLGSEVPVLSTVFGAAAAGGFATIPQSSYNYKDIGVNLEITPRVTYDGDIVLDLSVENSALGASIDVGGQSAPSFTSRKVHTFLRLREGEANLLAGLMQNNESTTRNGVPGIGHIPGIKNLFTNNVVQNDDTDIVMLITPHIVRDHDLTSDDVGSIFIGPQSNVGLTGPPPLIAPVPDGGTGGATTATPAAGVTPAAPASSITPGGLNRPPVGAPEGAQNLNTPPPPGTSPVPTFTPPPPTGGAPPASTAQAAPGAPVSPAPTGAGVPPTTVAPSAPTSGAPPATAAGGGPPAGTTTPRDVTTPLPSTPVGPPPATAAQIIISPPGTEFRLAGGPYTVPVSINNATRVSVLTLTVTYNPAVLRVRTVQDGTFMRQGGVTAAFTPRIDAAAGRVDIAVSRAGDQTGASGAGLLAALIFDAVGPGTTSIAVTGVANAPDGSPIALSFAPVTVTVR